MIFDRIAILDWSAASTPTPARPSADAIWIGVAGEGETYHRTRTQAMDRLETLVRKALARRERLLIGADFPFAYPAGFAAALTGQPLALSLWDWLADHVQDAPDNRNNRFALAAAINARFAGIGPFWGRPAGLDLPDLPDRGSVRHGHPFPERRAVEALVRTAQPCWKLYTTGSVGSQALLGIPALARLRTAFPGQVSVWPFEAWQGAPIVLAEVYPSLLAAEVRIVLAGEPAEIKDRIQVRLLAGALSRLDRAGTLGPALAAQAPAEVLAEQGWILGVGHEAVLRAAASHAFPPLREDGKGGAPPVAGPPLTPPRLRNDCFALPQGVDWVPVDAALDRLRQGLTVVAGAEAVPLAHAHGRVLSSDIKALRANPPAANAAVDGYGLAHAATVTGVNRLPLVRGRAAAGVPFAGEVPHGSALRILTGAILPPGVDCVVLDEDTATDGTTVAFDGPLRPRANTRRAGEDLAEGATALPQGRRLRAPDLALLAAVGVAEVPVFRPLRVGVLSTGDEIVPAPPALPHQTLDANRPMLLAILRDWGHEAMDLGHCGDDPGRLVASLDRAARRCDAILTSGGASGGDEDHVARLLADRGVLSSWRIAMKPGRPLALALWRGVPLFGLPGNPVAAMVCTLVFAHPALSLMAGAGWAQPQAFTVPAAFSKSKKPGRREYLRARLDADGRAEVYASEGSGRIAGLSWATGLVELPDGAVEVTPGDPVRFLPYAGFGLRG